MSYQQWDAIADLYIPLLMFAIIAHSIFSKRAKTGIHRILALGLSIVVVYSFMFIDLGLGLFAQLGLDYSTHSALSLALVCFFLYARLCCRYIALVTLLLYFILMVYQNYHSITDIVVTVLLTAPLFVFLQYKAMAKEESHLSS